MPGPIRPRATVVEENLRSLHLRAAGGKGQGAPSTSAGRQWLEFCQGQMHKYFYSITAIPCLSTAKGSGKDKTSHKGRPTKLVGLAEARDLPKDSCQ